MGAYWTVFALGIAVVFGSARGQAELPPRWDNSRLLGAGEPVMPVLGEEVYAGIGLDKPVLLLPYEDNGEEWNLLVDRHGKLFSFPSDAPTGMEVAIDFVAAYPEELTKRVLTLGAVFSGNEQVFVVWNTLQGAESENVISRFEVASLRPLRLDLGSRLDVIRWRSNGHNGCDLHFGPEDGYLYASTGDGQTPGDPANTGQDTDNLLGSILRLDVSASTVEEPYRIPEDNPFVGIEGTRPELWAYGLRNPWRMAFHPDTHELWIADNGDTDWEMVHVTKRGANHGWSAYESFHPFRAGNVLKGPSLELTPPIFEHSHAEMRSIIGGVFYRGDGMPELRDHYIYGCYFTKRVWAVSYAGDEIGEPFPVANLGRGLVAFVENGEGEVLVTCHDGAIMKLVPNPDTEVEPIPLPETLSETGLFADVREQAFAPGVHRYDIIAESWNDGATKGRAFALPPKKEGEGFRVLQGEEVRSGYRPPEGTAFVQTLSLGEKPVETQVMFYDGVWRGYSYQWREDGSDADLVPEEGATAMIGDQSWRFVSRGECMICHTQKTGFLGAFRTKDLNRAHPDGGETSWSFGSNGNSS